MSYRFFRHPKTASERRSNQEKDKDEMLPEYDFGSGIRGKYLQRVDADAEARAKRRPANLPSSWSDIGRTIQRTWKVFRKTRWWRMG